MKYLLMLMVLFSGCSNMPGLETPYDETVLSCAVGAQSMDALTTVIGAATPGVGEINPLGIVGAVVVKPGLIWFMNQKPEPERTKGLHVLTVAGYGASAHNACILIGLALGAGVSTSACFVLFGLPVAYYAHKNPC